MVRTAFIARWQRDSSAYRLLRVLIEEKAQGLFAGKFETNSGRPFAGFFTVKWVPVLGAACSNAGRWNGKQSVKKVSVRDQIERVAGRIAAFQWYVDHPRMEDGRCRFCGTTAASCPCMGNNKRNLIYWENRLAVLRAESTLTPEEVEKILKDSRRMVEKRERDEMLERLENA